MAAKKTALNFEKNLQELEQLVAALESGDLSLEQSLSTFEKGIEKTRACQAALAAAEQKVNVLLEQDGQLALDDFKPDE